MSEVTELAWKCYEDLFKSILNESFKKYDDYVTLKHYSNGILDGACIYSIEDKVLYCHELFINSKNPFVFIKWWRLWQKLADKVKLKTFKTNEKLIQFLLNHGCSVVETNGNFLIMEGCKNG